MGDETVAGAAPIAGPSDPIRLEPDAIGSRTPAIVRGSAGAC